MQLSVGLNSEAHIDPAGLGVTLAITIAKVTSTGSRQCEGIFLPD
jgi:hypothetical protein